MDAKGFVHGSVDRVNGYIRFPFPFPIAIPDEHIDTIWIDSDPTSASVRLCIDQGASHPSVECAIIYRNNDRMQVVREYWNVVLAFLMTCAPKRVPPLGPAFSISSPTTTTCPPLFRTAIRTMSRSSDEADNKAWPAAEND